MAKLDELRERFRSRPVPPEAADDGIEDDTYVTLDINGMGPNGQLFALTDAATATGWNPTYITCEGGSFVIREDGASYRLSFVNEGGRTKVVVPYRTPEVAEKIRIKCELPFALDVSVLGISAPISDSIPSTYAIKLSELAGLGSSDFRKGLSEDIYNGAMAVGWPASTIITVDRDIFKGVWQVCLTAAGNTIEMEIPEEFHDYHLEIPSYPPERIATGAPAPLSFSGLTHATGEGPVSVPPVPSKPAVTGYHVELRGENHDVLSVMTAVRGVLVAAGWPSGTRVVAEMDGDGGDIHYKVLHWHVTKVVDVTPRRNLDGMIDTVITVPFL